jgi:pimeloyl-ACP methyl ester carboxylesterase
VAWTTAALYPARVRTLSVISRPHPQAFLRALKEDPAQSNRSAHHRNNQRPEATREALAENGVRMREAMMREGVPAEDVDAYLGPLLEHAALDAAINWYRAMGRSTIRARDIPAVTMPTLYVWGTRDATVGRLAAAATKDFVHARYRFVELEDVGHFVTDQVPDAFPPLLIEHLTRMDRA